MYSSLKPFSTRAKNTIKMEFSAQADCTTSFLQTIKLQEKAPIFELFTRPLNERPLKEEHISPSSRQKTSVEECIFDYISLHIEMPPFNKNSLLQSHFFSIFAAGWLRSVPWLICRNVKHKNDSKNILNCC